MPALLRGGRKAYIGEAVWRSASTINPHSGLLKVFAASGELRFKNEQAPQGFPIR
jgi:hypothetical protein